MFGEINSRIEFEYKVMCTYMEIYNERIFDLLSDLGNPDQATDYTIIEERECRGVFVRGLTEVEVRNENEALNLLFSGELTRTTATHKLNRKSNRSHSLFTIYVQQRQRSGVSERVVHSKLHLVDLAGSERLKKTAMDGLPGYSEVTKRESMCINQSLTYLEQCVVALARKGSNHIPYRQSKLTNILKDCLGANCNTLMFACIWGEADHIEETVSTLRLASRMMKVQNETTKVETIDSDALIKKQAKMIKALKQELLMHDALVERTGVGYDPYTPEQQAGVVQMLERYINASEMDEEDQLSISSFRHMLEICKQFKKMVLTARAEQMQGSAGFGIGGRPLSSADLAGMGAGDFALENKIADEYDPKTPMVGEVERGVPGRGFSLGTVDASSRPLGGMENFASTLAEPKKYQDNGSPSSKMDRSGKGNDFSRDAKGRGGGAASFTNDFMEGTSQGVLFESYTRSEGSEIYSQFVLAKSQVKDERQKCKDITLAINESKALIDSLFRDIERRKTSRIELLKKSGLKPADTEDIVDEEEFRLMKELKDAKRAYKNGYEQLLKQKGELAHMQNRVEAIKAEVAAGFLAWCENGVDGKRDSDLTGQGFGGGGADPVDQLDDQEAFDRLELERVMSNDPDSLAFFNAQKTRRAHLTQNGGSIRQILKNKRLHN